MKEDRRNETKCLKSTGDQGAELSTEAQRTIFLTISFLVVRICLWHLISLFLWLRPSYTASRVIIYPLYSCRKRKSVVKTPDSSMKVQEKWQS